MRGAPNNASNFQTLILVQAIKEKEYQEKQGIPVSFGEWKWFRNEKSSMMDEAIELMFQGESPIELRKHSPAAWMKFFINNKKSCLMLGLL